MTERPIHRRTERSLVQDAIESCGWSPLWITTLHPTGSSSLPLPWRSQFIQVLYLYQSTKIFLYLLVGFPFLILPYDPCLQVQASLAHSHLQTMWNSWRCNTYLQSLLIGIFLILLTLGSDTKIMVSAGRLKSKEQTGRKQEEKNFTDCTLQG